MIEFIKTLPDVIRKILNHIDTSPITELLLKIISVNEVTADQEVDEVCIYVLPFLLNYN
jgi:hypothetical protein